MTRDQISQRAAEELEDAGYIHFTRDAINDSIDDGYQLLALTTGFYEKATTISIVADQSWYDLSTLIPDFFYCFSIFNTSNRRWLVPERFAHVERSSIRWQTIGGNPFIWIPIDHRFIQLYPCPTTNATDILYVYYKAFPPSLVSNAEPEFATELHEILVDYVVQDLLGINLEYTKGDMRFSRFMDQWNELRNQVNKRALPDRVRSLTCSYLMTPTLIA